MSWFRRRIFSGSHGDSNAHAGGRTPEPDGRSAGTPDDRGERFPFNPPRGVDAGFCYNDDRKE